MRTYESKIGPEEARRMLGKSAAFTNRNINKDRVRNYAADMASGNWLANGEPIILDEDGTVIDGQHRLQAVVVAGATVPFLFVAGVPRSHAKTIDQGLSRTISHSLQMGGQKNACQVVAAARSLHQLRASVDPKSDTGRRHNADNSLATTSEIEAYLADDAEGIEDFYEAMPKAAAKAVRLCELAAVTYEMSLIESQSEALAWASGFEGGLPSNDPRHVLRERLLDDRVIIASHSASQRTIARTRVQRLDLLVQSWNLWIGGHTAHVRSLLLRPSVADTEYQVCVPVKKALSASRNADMVNRRTIKLLKPGIAG